MAGKGLESARSKLLMQALCGVVAGHTVPFPRALGEVAAFGEGRDAVGGAEGQRHDGHGGLAAARSDQAAAIAEEKILYIVSLVIGIDDRSLRIVAHAAGAEQVYAELLLVDGESPFLFGVGGVKQFHRASRQPVGEFQIVGMILVREAKRG